MGKAWSVLFGVTMFACGALFFVAPALGWWLPPAVSSHASEIDFLFYVILAITGFFFVLTEAILVAFMWRYGTTPTGAAPEPGPSVVGTMIKPLTNVLNSPHKVEMAWTVIPAAILLYLAIAQVSTWADVKYQTRLRKIIGSTTPVTVDVSARQFEWRMRYPSSQRFKSWLDGKDKDAKKDFESFARHEHYDDIKSVVNELHVWKDHPVLVHLSTRDVIHSFNLPHLRVKQDALPGKMIPVWFTPTKANTKFDEATGTWQDGYNSDTRQTGDKTFIWDLACAELCGWGHYRMIGRIFVHETKEDFLRWLEATEAASKSTK